jgi:cellulose synthase/poly-beta-1,6-N-acetylglucosamine synthase-like glycosyltransferase
VESLFWACLILVAYVYVGYPTLAWVAARVRPRAWKRNEEYLPPLTMVISAHNEAGILPAKLENTLALDYPRERLQALVVSDGSDDATVDIAAKFPCTEVCETGERVGKSEALNRAWPRVRGRVVVFSDANVMYEADALRKFVRNFSDQRVGCVCGELRYRDARSAPSSRGESLYWLYESRLREWEGRRGALLSPNGTLFAVRRELFRPLSPRAANDFQTAEDVAEQGAWVVYDRGACAWEGSVSTHVEEFLRKARIVAGCSEVAFRRMGRMRPARTLRMLSHKILRWLVPLLLGGMLAGSAALAPARPEWAVVLGVQALFYGCALLGMLPGFRRVPLFYLPLYFVVVNAASVVGLWRFATRTQKPAWESPRSNRADITVQSHG